jgi:hypothetical protein
MEIWWTWWTFSYSYTRENVFTYIRMYVYTAALGSA